MDDLELGEWAPNSNQHNTAIRGGHINNNNLSNASGERNKDLKGERLEALTLEEAKNESYIVRTGTETVRISTPPPAHHNAMIKGGRDGGGSRSGAGSPAYSSEDSDSEVWDRLKALPVRTRMMARELHGELVSSVDVEEDAGCTDSGAWADALGDYDGDDHKKDVY